MCCAGSKETALARALANNPINSSHPCLYDIRDYRKVYVFNDPSKWIDSTADALKGLFPIGGGLVRSVALRLLWWKGSM